MPETHDLDAAFDALAQQAVTRGHRPGARAAIRRARRRRNRSVAGIAVVAVVAAGGIANPQLLPDRLPGSGAAVAGTTSRHAAPLDAASLGDATRGWVDGWRDEPRASAGFASPSCFPLVTSSLSGGPRVGSSLLTAPDGSSAKVLIADLESVTQAATTWESQLSALENCGEVRPSPAGGGTADAQVRHYVVVLPGTSELRLTDIWVARSGSAVAVLLAAADAGPAPEGVVEAVGDALVSGARSGWTQRTD